MKKIAKGTSACWFTHVRQALNCRVDIWLLGVDVTVKNTKVYYVPQLIQKAE